VNRFDDLSDEVLEKIVQGFTHENWNFWRGWFKEQELQAIRNLETRSPHGTPAHEEMLDVTRNRERISLIRMIGTMVGELMKEYDKRHTS